MIPPTGTRISRRCFGSIAVGTLATLSVGGSCHPLAQLPGSDGRLTARPGQRDLAATGKPDTLRLDSGHGALFRAPTASGASSWPLLLLFHGAGGSGRRILDRLGAHADAAGFAVLAPTAQWSTWDAIGGSAGPDVRFVNRALQRVFDTSPIDPARICVAGFSDGATYALALGLVNGDLFHKVVAFSAGFLIEGTPHGHARFFVSHGTSDRILPIDRCGRPIVATLRSRGYDVTFREFDGGHQVPPDIAREAMEWAAEP